MSHQVVVAMAKYLVVLPVIVSGIWWAFVADRSQRIRYLSILVGGGVLAYLLAKVGGHLYDDPRPFIADQVVPYFQSATDNGFPSDHTMLSAVFAAAMWPFNRVLSGLFYVIAVAVGLARVVAGVHHGVDVIGGLAFGTAGVAAVWAAMTLLERRRLVDV
jgi:membrane-associated phospholipid phosphatase